MNAWDRVSFSEFMMALATVTILGLLLPYPEGEYVIGTLLLVYLVTSGALTEIAGFIAKGNVS